MGKAKLTSQYQILLLIVVTVTVYKSSKTKEEDWIRFVQFGFPIGRYEVDLVNLAFLIFFASCSITKTEVSCGESGECRAGGLRLFLSHDSSISSYIITYNLRSDLLTPVTDYRSIIRIISFHFTVKLPHVLSVTCNIFLIKKNRF